MAGETVLVVEDEPDVLEVVRYNLTREGFKVLTAMRGDVAVQVAQAKAPDLVILDLMLPEVDGFEVCRRLRGDPRTRTIPVIMLTAKGEESDMVAGLELGADDYIPKPFSVRVLMARVRAALRRPRGPAGGPAEEPVLRLADLVIDPGRHEVLVKGRPVELTHTEFRLLYVLAQRPGRVFSREQIVDAVKGPDYPVTDRAVDVQVVGLRRKLGPRAACIDTVRGVGYRFKLP
jgi:two-component system phosphate regulon response regulator PhoB